jgi:transposase
MLLVDIEKPEGETLAHWFSELRSWLDDNRCEPAMFMQAGRRLDRLIYRVAFESAPVAHKFLRRFAHYSPSLRRATTIERRQLRAMEKVAS